jgi:hypothetical protein
MSWVTPRTAAVGDLFTAAWVNEIEGDLAYLHGDAGTIVLSAGLVIPNNTGVNSKDTGGTTRTLAFIDPSNRVQIDNAALGVTFGGDVIAKGGHLVGHPSTQGVWVQGGSGETGSSTDGTGSYFEDVTFPTAFGTAAISVVVSGYGSAGATIGENSITRTGFRALSSGATDSYYWMAIGY